MSQDWYRNTAWNAEIEAVFHLRLRRVRDKAQLLRIQASHLVDSHPAAALNLLEQYFSLGDHFDMAQAYVVKAQALVPLGDLAGAISAYEAALERERQVPSLKTQAYLDFPCFVVRTRIEHMYARALDVLDTHRDRPVFPIEQYRAHGTRALLLHHFGRDQEASGAASLAMRAAQKTQSGGHHRQHLGLVQDIDDAFARRVAAIAEF